MKIYTSYFANWKNFGNLVPISISLWPPQNYKGKQYIKIAPTKEMLITYKKTYNEQEYKKHYWHDVLKHLSPENIINELSVLSDGKDCVLLCYEKPGSFCHRNLFATWMNKNGYDISEL